MMRITALVYFQEVIIKGKENIPAGAPCILACNHPNSFLDALIITVHFKRPLFYLARGDAFKKPFGAKLLLFLNNIPMYRQEEGAEHLTRNRESFDYCLEVLKKGDSILIFTEGICENEWYLRPFRKGTARLAFEALKDNHLKDKPKVIPVAVNYSGWFGTGNKIYIEFLSPLKFSEMNVQKGLYLQKFNSELRNSLAQCCVSIDKNYDVKVQNTLAGFILKNLSGGTVKAMKSLRNFWYQEKAPYPDKYEKFVAFTGNGRVPYYCEKKVSLLIFFASLIIIPPAVFLNIIPYFICKYIAEKTTHRNVFYDSVFFGSLLIIGTLYLLCLTCVTIIISHSLFGIAVPLIAFFCAAFYENAKKNIYCFLTPKRQSETGAMLADIC